MKIAQIAPLYEAVPPHRYGGTERVVAALSDGLVDRGHDVTLFAAGESVTRAKLHEAMPAPLRTRMTRAGADSRSPRTSTCGCSPSCIAMRDFDVIHSHLDVWTMPFAAVCQIPTVDDPARATRPADVARRAGHVPRRSPGLDQRRPARRRRRTSTSTGWRPCPTASSSSSYLDQPPLPVTISPSSAGCAPRRASTRRSRGPPLRTSAAHRRQGRPDGRRVLRVQRSSRCSARTRRSSARSAKTASRRSSLARRRRCSRSTGPSRSAS